MMKQFLLAAVVFCGIIGPAAAQDDLFGTTKEPERKGVIIGLNGDIDLPGADMAKRFGLSFRIGPSVLYKTQNNWMFGAKSDFIFGNKVHEDSLLYNVSDQYGGFISSSGERIGVQIYERGYLVGLEAGKLIPIRKSHPDNCWLIMTGAGFIQHKISLFDKDKTIPQLRGDYKKGYDRLTNGWYVEQFVGFNKFDRHGLLNFNIGVDIMAGFTAGRRDYLYDVMRKDGGSRVDLLFGIRGGWYIPLFRKKTEEIYFE
jgi:hypothetical protein